MEAWMNDVPAAVRATQRALRQSVPDVAGRHARLTEALRDEVSSLLAEQRQGSAVPEVSHADIVAGRVGRETLSAAMDWASDQMWGGPEPAAVRVPDKKHLH